MTDEDVVEAMSVLVHFAPKEELERIVFKRAVRDLSLHIQDIQKERNRLQKTLDEVRLEITEHLDAVRRAAP